MLIEDALPEVKFDQVQRQMVLHERRHVDQILSWFRESMLAVIIHSESISTSLLDATSRERVTGPFL